MTEPIEIGFHAPSELMDWHLADMQPMVRPLRSPSGFAQAFPGRMECGCRRCLNERDERTADGFPVLACRMIVCCHCGNKRCPHADDHRFKCTNSNAVDQVPELAD